MLSHSVAANHIAGRENQMLHFDWSRGEYDFLAGKCNSVIPAKMIYPFI